MSNVKCKIKLSTLRPSEFPDSLFRRKYFTLAFSARSKLKINFENSLFSDYPAAS